MALKAPRQGLVLASVVGIGNRLSNLQRVWFYLDAVLGLGYLFLCKMPQYRRTELFSTELWTEVTAGSHVVLVKWGSLAAAAGGLAGRGGEGRPGHRAGPSVQGAHRCQSSLVPCLAWLTAAAPRDPILPPSCMSSIAVPALCCAGQSRGQPALPDPPARRLQPRLRHLLNPSSAALSAELTCPSAPWRPPLAWCVPGPALYLPT